MKKKQVRNLGMAISFCTVLFVNTSCINQIDSEIVPGTTPITFSFKVSTTTKVTNSTFDKGDKVGLFAMLTSTPVDGKRYIDNVRLECGENSTLIPEKNVFYPEGDATLDFISYYPYQTVGAAEGSSFISVSVQIDQSNDDKRSKSDFLIATASNITSSDQAVKLEFKHKFAKLKLVLTPKPGEKAEDMLKANPKIIATGFKTQATYDMLTDDFTNLEEEADITPHGVWVLKDGTLIGKELIIIPQTMQAATHALIMEWNGKTYTCPIPDLSMEGSTQCEINIDALQSTSQILTGVTANIEDWTTVEGKDCENIYNMTGIHIAALSFDQSDVYRVYHQGKPVAEICKELLSSPDGGVSSQAIVVYSVDEDEKTNLSQGNVLQLLDETAAFHGGKVLWNTETNTFNYEPGTSQPISIFYINSSGSIALEKPEVPLAVNIISQSLLDMRKGVLQTYPIVKIGTQYWMKENLCTTTYRNGTPIPLKTVLGNGAGYFKRAQAEDHFYNGEAILAGELAPDKWRIPNNNDWEVLKSYINNDASLLKTGEWKPIKEDDIVYPATNQTDFNIVANGLFVSSDKGTTVHTNLSTAAAYWIAGDTKGTLAEKAILLMSTKNTMDLGNNKPTGKEYYQAFSIRCIKE